MTNVSDEVITKLQKIMELAVRGATEGEMQAAMSRATELARKHGIELSKLPPREDSRRRPIDIKEETGFRTSTTYMHPYHGWVFHALQDVFGVRILYWKKMVGSHPYISNIVVIGEATDVAICRTLFPWLEGLFPKLYHKKLKAGLVAKNFAAQNGFYYGLAQGIIEANKQAEKAMPAADQQSWALVVADKQALIQQHVEAKHKVKEPKKERKKYDFDAVAEGQEEGKNIKLRQMPSSESGASGQLPH